MCVCMCVCVCVCGCMCDIEREERWREIKGIENIIVAVATVPCFDYSLHLLSQFVLHI